MQLSNVSGGWFRQVLVKYEAQVVITIISSAPLCVSALVLGCNCTGGELVRCSRA